MTTALSVITTAYRETNIIPLGTVPNTNQINEALPLLNNIILFTVGTVIGEQLSDANIGGTYDQSDITFDWVPANVRLVFNDSSAQSLYLDPVPYPGQRLAVVDALNNFNGYNVTLNGNGRLIEGATSIVLNTNGDNRQWIYRDDLGNWVKLTTLTSSDSIPFPQDFDDYFSTMLAMRLNPRYGQALGAETTEMLSLSKRNLRARYRNNKDTLPDYAGRLEAERYPRLFNGRFDGRFWRWR